MTPRLTLTADRMRFHRCPAVQITRPFDFCFDADGRLWESYGTSLIRYDPRAAEAIQRITPGLEGRRGNALARLGESLLFFHYAADDFTVLDPHTGVAERRPLPPKTDGTTHDIWFCLETAGKVLAFDRGQNGAVLVFDRTDAPPRRVACPLGDLELIDGQPLPDGRVLMPTAGQVAVLLFDPVKEAFTDTISSEYQVSFAWGAMYHDGLALIADTSGGRFLVCDTRAKRWREPIPTPDYGRVYGYIGQGFQIGSRGYFNLNTWQGNEAIDRKTHQLHTPPGYKTQTVDGKRMHFLDRFLVFDAATQRFDYLISPPQADGVAEMCYSKYQDGQVFITGHIIPVKPGEPWEYKAGDYCVWACDLSSARRRRSRHCGTRRTGEVRPG